jgi:hypothetical protein
MIHLLLLAAALSAPVHAAPLQDHGVHTVVSETPAPARVLTVTGLDGRHAQVSATDLAKLPRHRVALDIHGERHVFEGPLLIDVLGAVDVPTGRALRGPALGQAVVVTAADGYRVAFGLAELDPGTRANPIILADRMDGAALPAADGAFRLVVEGDLRPARAARDVVSATVIDLGAAPRETRPLTH